jgi:hypothetical protein
MAMPYVGDFLLYKKWQCPTSVIYFTLQEMAMPYVGDSSFFTLQGMAMPYVSDSSSELYKK